MTIPVLAALSWMGCAAPWDATREGVVDPVNALLHQRYPAALGQQDAAAVASLWTGERAEHAATDAAARLAGWRDISQAYCRICSVERVPTDDQGVTRAHADVELRFDGVGLDGKARTVFERRRLELVQTHAPDDLVPIPTPIAPGGVTDRAKSRPTAHPAEASHATGSDSTGSPTPTSSPSALRGWRIASDTRTATRTLTEGGPTFTDETEARGPHFTHNSFGVPDRDGVRRKYLPGSGLGLGDADGDGLDDVVTVGGREVRLFLNRGGKFQDETEARGIEPIQTGEGRYAIFGDVDNDGDRDVFIGVLDGHNQLYINDGSGRFARISGPDRGIPSSMETTGACFADFDKDGDLDLFIANGQNLLRTEPEPVYNAANGTPNQLLFNDGRGRFHDVTDDAGVGDTGWALACTATDYDADGDVDIYIANDFGEDRLYRNAGDGTFAEISHEVGISHRGSSMGATFGDCNGDGHLDVFIAGMGSNSAWILDQPGFPAPAPWYITMFFHHIVMDMMREMFWGNRLYVSRGDGTFEEVSQASQTDKSGWAWGGVFWDYDNDGRQDLYVLNGLLTGDLPDDC